MNHGYGGKNGVQKSCYPQIKKIKKSIDKQYYTIYSIDNEQ